VKGKRPDTKLVQGGRNREWTQGAVSPPVWRASTIVFETIADMHEAYPPEQGRLHYGRHGTPTTWGLCDALTQLEPEGKGTWLYSSGLAAVSGALMSVLRTGDELLVADNVFGPTRRFCDRHLRRFGVSVSYYDPSEGAAIRRLFTDRTKVVLLESPGSITMEVQDVPAICEVAHAHDIVTVLDNTWATPLLFPALAAGVDISVIACTKYIAGHADVMLGSATANSRLWGPLRDFGMASGQTASPDDAFLTARGLRTLGLRLRRHGESALAVAKWLSEQPQVSKVLHPALPDCPGNDLWERDFLGSSGLFSFVLRGGSGKACAAMVDRLSHFGKGYSWGGFESLAIPMDVGKLRTVNRWDPRGPLVRLSIGLEDVDDLIEDLAAALASYEM